MNDPQTEPESGPHWRRIAGVIEREIATGQYAMERPLPTVLDFAERFAVNRHTIRQALSSLQARGLVSLERGRGTFLVERTIDYRLGRRVRFRGNLADTGLEAKGEILSAEIIAAESVEADLLGLAPGVPLWRIVTMNRAGRHPISLGRHALSADQFPDFADRLRTHDISTTATFGSYGYGDYVRLTTRIEARTPDPEEMRLLALPHGVPVLATDGLDGTAGGKPLQRATTAFAAHRVRLVVEPEGSPAAEIAEPAKS